MTHASAIIPLLKREQIDEILHRVDRGWVVRPSQIKVLARMAQLYLDERDKIIEASEIEEGKRLGF